MSEQIKVSVIVTTKNEAHNIENFLKSIKEQTYKNIEIIVVDNGSTDTTKEISKKYTDMVFDKGPERSAQRNYGVEVSNGSYVLVLDADMLLTPGVIAECVSVVTVNPDIKTITIPEVSFGENYWAKAKALERSFYFNDPAGSAIEAARFFERPAFLEFGGYDLNITGPEDWDLPERINQKYPLKHKIKSHLLHNEGKLSLWRLMSKKFYYALKLDNYLDKNRISKVSPKTVYFLRSTFYKNWRLWLKDPVLSIGTLIMINAEFAAGVLGYLWGKIQKNS